MKKVLRVISVLILLSMLPMQVFAEAEAQPEIVEFDDGSYITIQIVYDGSRAGSTRTGSKIYTYRNSDGVEEWRATLRGSFNYNGATAVCTTATCTVTITDTDWYTVSKSASKSGSIARADVTMGLVLSGITINQKSCSITLACDPDGNLS